jgi:hypothetical protein
MLSGSQSFISISLKLKVKQARLYMIGSLFLTQIGLQLEDVDRLFAGQDENVTGDIFDTKGATAEIEMDGSELA